MTVVVVDVDVDDDVDDDDGANAEIRPDIAFWLDTRVSSIWDWTSGFWKTAPTVRVSAFTSREVMGPPLENSRVAS